MGYMIDNWTAEYHGITWAVQIHADEDATPEDCEDYGTDPEEQRAYRRMHEEWRRGDWQYVGVVVTATIGDALAEAWSSSVWAVQYGFGKNNDDSEWTQGKDEINSEYLRDLASDALALIKRDADKIRHLLSVVDQLA